MPDRVQTVLIVGDFADVTGGQAKVAIDSAVMLAQSGLEVVFLAACGPVSAQLRHPRIRVVCLDGHTVLDDPNRLRAMVNGIWNRRALRMLRQEVAALDPARSVVHCHGYAKALSPSIGRCLAETAVPAVFTMHEYFLACPNGGFFNYRTGQICHLRPLGAQCITTNCDVRSMSHKLWRVARGAVAAGPGRLPGGLRDIIYISQTQKRVMGPFLPPQARLHHVSNPVATTAEPVDAAANRHLMFVGRLSPEKGAVQLARVAGELGWPVRFVGDGPDAADIRRVNPDAEITGWVSPDVVQQHLARARAVVVPSLWYEGQPLVPIEALLRGIPVVCGQWNAAAEEVVDGVNGAIYPAATDQALTDALRRVATIPAFRSDALAEKVSPARHLARLIEVYSSLSA